ncbi:pimeloyl-ACP methyl esterase BioG family protein [Campylobacter pinnipediorum]|uniref:pimeloyl-ACP methyl esterase BioG family protein n=1 Tax=Campylobacter pinnipediorum TaxID=1965231 RepID=UPI00084D7ACF|nr:pimeloyl-ACP methyl esterase BioG family protein [Campylobacter pinnipediorum]
MKFNYLAQNNSENLLLFFTGFASEPSHFLHLKISDKFDIAIIYEYESLNFSKDLLSKYTNIQIIAFSMGVGVASRIDFNLLLNNKQKLSFNLAIGGTPYGIDRVYGIHGAIFKRSIESFEPNEFIKNMGAKDLAIDTKRDYKKELKYLFDLCQNEPINTNWQKALAGASDKIFPPTAMQKFFKEKLSTIEAGHFVFNKFKSWDEFWIE